jgi:hypothetical protein
MNLNFVKCNDLSKIIILLVLLSVLTPNHAEALSFVSPLDGTTVSCDVSATESIAVKVVSCIKTIVNGYSTAFLQYMSDFMRPIILALMLLSVILTAMRVMLGERNPAKIILSSFFKMVVVIGLSDNLGASSGMFGPGGIKDATFSLMEGLQVVIIDNMYSSTATCDLNSHSGVSGGVITSTTYRPFAYMDCILQYVMGFNVAAGIGASLLGFVSSALFSGTMGAAVFFFGVATLLAITFFVLRVIFTVIICYVYAGLLIGLGPLIVWTLMFKYCEQTFFKYFYNILAAVLMPFLMVAFMAVAIPLLDKYVLDPATPTSLVNVLGTNQNVAPPGGTRIVDHYRSESSLCDAQFPTDPLFSQGLDASKIRENSLNPLKTGGFDWCSAFKVSSVDLGDNHNKKLWKIAQSLLQITFVVWIITSVGNWIPNLVTGLLQSSGGRALAGVIGDGMPLEGVLQSGFKSQVSGATGPGGKPVGGFTGIGSLMQK